MSAGSPFNQWWAFCYAKRAQKPIDHDLYVGQRPHHDRPGAYRHPANESAPVTGDSARHKMIGGARNRRAAEQRDERAAFHCPVPPVLRTKDRIAQHCCAAGFQSGLCLLRVEPGKRKRLDGLYGIDISSMNLRHHWNASSRTSAADVSDLPSVIHSSEACAV